MPWRSGSRTKVKFAIKPRKAYIRPQGKSGSLSEKDTKQQNEADSGPDYRDEFTVNKLYSVKNGKPIREVDPIKAIEK